MTNIIRGRLVGSIAINTLTTIGPHVVIELPIIENHIVIIESSITIKIVPTIFIKGATIVS